MEHGWNYKRAGENLPYLDDEFVKVKQQPPAPAATEFLGLIGEYGWDHNTLFVFEKDGKLHVLIDWFLFYPLTKESENVYHFPDYTRQYGDK